MYDEWIVLENRKCRVYSVILFNQSDIMSAASQHTSILVHRYADISSCHGNDVIT